MRRNPAPPPTAADVLEAVTRLAAQPGRTVPCGRGTIELDSPSVTDISRALGSYEMYVTPLLRQLVASGQVVGKTCGPFKLYRPVVPQEVAV